jgi:hypothetical protein
MPRSQLLRITARLGGAAFVIVGASLVVVAGFMTEAASYGLEGLAGAGSLFLGAAALLVADLVAADH